MRGGSASGAAIGTLTVCGATPFKALNTSSRHGPHSAVPVAPNVTSVPEVRNAVHMQHPDSSRSTPSAEMHTEPLIRGGTTSSNCTSATHRVSRFTGRMSSGGSWNRGYRSSSAPKPYCQRVMGRTEVGRATHRRTSLPPTSWSRTETWQRASDNVWFAGHMARTMRREGSTADSRLRRTSEHRCSGARLDGLGGVEV